MRLILLLSLSMAVASAQQPPSSPPAQSYSAQDSTGDSSREQKAYRDVHLELSFRVPPKGRLYFSPLGNGEAQEGKRKRYSVSAPGLASHGPYLLKTWEIGTPAPVVAVRRVMVDDSGVLRCDEQATDCPGAEGGSKLVVGVSGTPGQPRSFLLVGPDQLSVAMGEVVPFPVSGSDRGCSVEVALLAADGSAALVLGHGFQPDEQVKFASESFEDKVKTTHQASQTGDVLTVLLPFVKGHDEGITTLSLAGAKCSPGAAFLWGKQHEVLADTVFGK
jgi:hypothetical protein